MCRELGVSRSGYYAWRRRQEFPCRRVRDDRSLIVLMRSLFAQARGNPGVRRMRAQLAAVGHRVSAKRVHRLMRAAGLQGRHPRAWKRTTVPGEDLRATPDLVGRCFTAGKPNEKWCGDITYIRTWEGWFYLATVIDLHSRAIVGYALADHMKTGLVTDALSMALRRRRPARTVIFHSDRGTQYTSTEFAGFCRRHGITRSLGRTGICYDNAVSESVFATYKKELIHTRPWPDRQSVKRATIDWIENYYNTIRRHSSLGYLTPSEYELGFRDINQLAA